MEKVTIDEVDTEVDAATVRRTLTDALGTTNLAVNYYELDPGDSFAYGYHTHGDQEEVFLVRSGTATFETEAGDVEVGAGEAIRFGPGEYQRGTNRGERRVVAVALGAPRESGESEILRECADCGERTPQAIERDPERERNLTRCEDCGAVTGEFYRTSGA